MSYQRNVWDAEFCFYFVLFILFFFGGVVGALMEGPPKKETEKPVESVGCPLPQMSPVCMSRNVDLLLKGKEHGK